MKTVTVDAEALREVLVALCGPGYLISELQAIRALREGKSPIDTLIEACNAQAAKAATEGKEEANDARTET